MDFMLRGSQHKIPYLSYGTWQVYQSLNHWICVTVPLVLGHTTNLDHTTDG